MMNTTSNTEYQAALSKALRKLDKTLGAVTVARSMTEPGTADYYRLKAAEYLILLTFDHIEANVGGPTARIGGEEAKSEWMQSEFRQGFDAGLDTIGLFLRTLELTEDEDEREAAVDRIFDERDRLTAARPCCKMMGVCGE